MRKIILFILITSKLMSQDLKEIKSLNTLICDPDSGVCEVPSTNNTIQQNALSMLNVNTSAKKIKVIYFTDPICSSCWGIEPQLKKLKLEYGELLDVEYRMGGLLPDWSYNSGGISKPSDVAHHWDEVSVYYDMPIDGDVWLEDPLHSSYPPSIAFKAAQMQDEKKAIEFLRILRIKLFLQKKNICKWEHVEAAALEVGLNIQELKNAYDDKAKKAFEDDLLYARSMGVRGFPTIFFIDEKNERHLVYGSRPYADYVNVIQKIKLDVVKTKYDLDSENLFKTFHTLTLKEYSFLRNIQQEKAISELRELESLNKLSRIDSKNGSIWISIY